MDIEKVRTKLTKKYGALSVASVQDLRSLSVIPYGISAQCLSLDFILGRPGFPAGRLCEIVGLESKGKSTHSYHILAECQRRGGWSVLLTSEGDVELSRLEAVGVNTTDLTILQPENIEQAFGMIEDTIDWIRRGEAFTGPLTIILDSVAGLKSSAEQAGGYNDQFMGLSARVIGQSLRKVMWVIGHSKAVLVFTNRFYSNMKRYDPAGEYNTYGGKAVGYWSSARVKVHSRKSDVLEDGKNNPVSTLIQATAFKNKIGPPFKSTKYVFTFATGIDFYEDLWRSCLTMRLLTSRKGQMLFNKKITLERKDWPDFVNMTYSSPHKFRELLSALAVKRGLLLVY